MATERMAMRKIREVLRLRWQVGRTVRETARALGVSLGVVSKMGARATTAGLTWGWSRVSATLRWRSGCTGARSR